MKKEVFKGEINGKKFDSVEEYNRAYKEMMENNVIISSCSYSFSQEEVDDKQLDLFDEKEVTNICNFYPSIDQALQHIVNANSFGEAEEIELNIYEDLENRFSYFIKNYKESMADKAIEMRRKSVDNVVRHYNNAKTENLKIESKIDNLCKEIDDLNNKSYMNDIEMGICEAFKDYYDDMLEHINNVSFSEDEEVSESKESDENIVKASDDSDNLSIKDILDAISKLDFIK